VTCSCRVSSVSMRHDKGRGFLFALLRRCDQGTRPEVFGAALRAFSSMRIHSSRGTRALILIPTDPRSGFEAILSTGCFDCETVSLPDPHIRSVRSYSQWRRNLRVSVSLQRILDRQVLCPFAK